MKIPIVDKEDQVICHKMKDERLPEDIIRVSALCIFNEKGQILLARRSMTETFLPGLWSVAVTGTVEEGETYEDNIVKEAEEEIGVKINNLIIGPKKLLSRGHEFFGHWFFANIPGGTEFTLNPEVEEVKWVTFAELEDWNTREPGSFVPMFAEDIVIMKGYENKIQ